MGLMLNFELKLWGLIKGKQPIFVTKLSIEHKKFDLR